MAQARAAKPNITFMVMGVNPRGTDRLDLIVETNRLYAQYAKANTTSQSPITYVDGYNGFSAATDTFDWVHPNLSGQHRITDRFASAMTQFCAANPPTGTTSTTTTTAKPKAPQLRGGAGQLPGRSRWQRHDMVPLLERPRRPRLP